MYDMTYVEVYYIIFSYCMNAGDVIKDMLCYVMLSVSYNFMFNITTLLSCRGMHLKNI